MTDEEKSVEQAFRDAADRAAAKDGESDGYALVVTYADGSIGTEYGGASFVRVLGAVGVLSDRIARAFNEEK